LKNALLQDIEHVFAILPGGSAAAAPQSTMKSARVVSGMQSEEFIGDTMSTLKWFVLICLGSILLCGCVHQPVRHLASDASLISPGTSTQTDVLTYLGDPDERQETAAGSERWLYYEEHLSTLQRTFYVGRWFDPKSVSRIIVTFDGEMVTDIQYNASETGEFERERDKTGDE
jgi:hypothetical protein